MTNTLIAAIIDQKRTTRAQAVELINLALTVHGRCTLACSCGAHAMAVDSDAIGNNTDVARALTLITHTLGDHETPHDVVATITKRIIVLSAARA